VNISTGEGKQLRIAIFSCKDWPPLGTGICPIAMVPLESTGRCWLRCSYVLTQDAKSFCFTVWAGVSGTMTECPKMHFCLWFVFTVQTFGPVTQSSFLRQMGIDVRMKVSLAVLRLNVGSFQVCPQSYQKTLPPLTSIPVVICSHQNRYPLSDLCVDSSPQLQLLVSRMCKTRLRRKKTFRAGW